MATKIKMKHILDSVSELYDVDVSDLKSASRKLKFAIPRQIFCYVAVDKGHTTMQVGRFLDRDHSTVVHAVRKVKSHYYRPEELDWIDANATHRHNFTMQKLREGITHGTA